MRLLLCEDWVYPWYGDVFLKRFRQLGVEAHPFKFQPYFVPRRGGWLKRASSGWAGMERKFRWGPIVQRINADLRSRADAVKPDVLFLYRADLIFPSTLRRIKQQGILIAGWNNDDPFSDRYPAYVWRHLLRGLPYHDAYFSYRERNIPEYRTKGVAHVELLRSYYVRELHHPLPSVRDSPYQCDVSFTGHWEDDGREQLIAAVLADRSIRFRLFGGKTWKASRIYQLIEARQGPVTEKYGLDYNRVLNSSKIALVFLSRINHDTYTRRCFEIPAAGTFMLSEYTDELNELLREGVEAEYFRSQDEMMDKIRFYLRHERARKRIARAGHQRVVQDGHEALDRAAQVVRCLDQLRAGQSTDRSATICMTTRDTVGRRRGENHQCGRSC